MRWLTTSHRTTDHLTTGHQIVGKKQAKRRLKKQQQKAAAERPQNLHQEHPRPVVPQVQKVALAVRVELHRQRMMGSKTPPK
jgi:hypothetical protein